MFIITSVAIIQKAMSVLWVRSVLAAQIEIVPNFLQACGSTSVKPMPTNVILRRFATMLAIKWSLISFTMTKIYRACWCPSGVNPDDAPVFVVRVGSSRRAAAAAARLEIKKLSGSLYFEKNSPEVAAFFAKLLRSNPRRPFYNLTAPELLKFIESAAYAADVENLSDKHSRRTLSDAVATHCISPFQAKNIYIKQVNL